MGLTVTTNIPCGNACNIEIRETAAVSEVSFCPDPHGGPVALWFCLRVLRKETGGAETLRLVLKNIHNLLGGRDARSMRPVARYEGGDWERLGPGVNEPEPDGRLHGAWSVPAPETWVDFAFCYPYGMAEVEALLRDTDGFFRADTIGVSQGGRPLIRLSNDPGHEGSERPGLYLISRQHSGETPGSWVLDGVLRAVAGLGDAAPLVWTVPLTNMDGIEQGDYGKDNFPYDLNRAWGIPPMRNETLILQRDMHRWRRRCRPVLAMDFHAPGGCETAGVYAFAPDPGVVPERHRKVVSWLNVIAAGLGKPYAADEFARVAAYASRWDTPRFGDFCADQLGLTKVSFETPYALCGDTVMTREEYAEVGRRIAAAVLGTI